MSMAKGDPDELERFAASLNSFLETVNDATNSLNNSFGALGDTWQDEKRAQFEEEYNALIKQLTVFNENASEHIPYLRTLASRLRDYLQS